MVYAKASSMVNVGVYAPGWLRRYIIGKSGANIKKITEEFPEVKWTGLYTDAFSYQIK